MLKHWREVKAQHPDTILFYRVGDFYEMFYDDAELAARVLDITLTSRGDGVPLAGVPVKAAAEYLRQLVGAGHRVAICEQVEDPKLAKGLVRREVVETVTPGALLVDGWIPGGRNNWIVAVGSGGRGRSGSRRSISAPASSCWRRSSDAGLDEALSRLSPAELVIPAATTRPAARRPRRRRCSRVASAWEFDPDLAREELARRFSPRLARRARRRARRMRRRSARPARCSATSSSSSPAGLPHLARPVVRRSDAFLWLDEMTRRNLELVEPLRAGARGCTLLETIDAHRDADGRPAAAPVAALAAPRSRRRSTPGSMRWTSRCATPAAAPGCARRSTACAISSGSPDARRPGRAAPRELGALRDSFQRLPDVAEALSALAGFALPGGRRAALLADAVEELDLLADLAARADAPRWRIARRPRWPTAA